MWLMLQQEKPDDHIVATGEAPSLRDFVELGLRQLGSTGGAMSRSIAAISGP
jgi:GDP-D-mannose dehydratase